MTDLLWSALTALAVIYGVTVPGVAVFAALTLRCVDREERERRVRVTAVLHEDGAGDA